VKSGATFGKRLKKAPLVFGVNYFLRDMNPVVAKRVFVNAVRDKHVWIKWMERRVHGELDAIETPTGASYSDTLRLGQSERLVIRDRDSGERYELQVMQTRWLARGLGEVASRTRLRTLHDGVVTEDSGDVDAWVTGGQVGGAGLP